MYTSREIVTTELGDEAQCFKCKEFWPADSEFFFMTKGKPHSWCKACFKADEKVQAKVKRANKKARAAYAGRRAAHRQTPQELHA